MSKSKLTEIIESIVDALADTASDPAETAKLLRSTAIQITSCKNINNHSSSQQQQQQHAQWTEESGELAAVAKLVVALLEGTARNFRILGLALLTHLAVLHAPTFVRILEHDGGVGLWARSFDICASELYWGLTTLFDDAGTELHALLVVVDKIVAVVKDKNSHPSELRGAAADLLCSSVLSRIRDLAKGVALAQGRSRAAAAGSGGGLADEMRRAAMQLLRAIVMLAPRKHLDSCGIISTIVDLYLNQDGNVVVSPGELAEVLCRCCIANRLSAHDTAALFFPYVDVATPADARAEVVAAHRRGRCEMVLRYLASSYEGVAVFNVTAPLGVRLLVDALGLSGGSIARKMLLMHLFVVLLHSAAPHREVHESGPWTTYARLESTHNNFMLRSQSFLDSSTVAGGGGGAGKKKKRDGDGDDDDEDAEGGDGFDLIEDEQDFKAALLMEIERDGVLVEAEPVTYFARDATLGAMLLIFEREGLSRSLVSVLLPAGATEIDPQLADGSIALMQTVLGLMRPLLALDAVVTVNQALDSAIASLLMQKNPIIGALISKKSAVSSYSIMSGGGGGGGGSLMHREQLQNNATAVAAASNQSLSDRIDQTKVVKVARMHEWNLFATLDVIQSRAVVPALAAKEKLATKFVKALLAFYSPDGLGDASLFGQQPFKSINRNDTIPTLGLIGVSLIESLLASGSGDFGSALLVEFGFPMRLADFFVGALMDQNSYEALTKTMAGDYLRWVRVFTSCTEGLRLLSVNNFFKRVREAARSGMAPQVWEMVLRAFSGKPIVAPDALGRYVLPQTDPRPQFYVDILAQSLADSASHSGGPSLASGLEGRSGALLARSFGASSLGNASAAFGGGPSAAQVIRYSALSQLFILASRARFASRAILTAAVKAVFDVMVAPDSDPRVRDLASQLLSMWLRLGGPESGTDTDEFLAFESAAAKIDEHVTLHATHIHSVLHTCFLLPRATEGNAPFAETLRRCMEKLVAELCAAPQAVVERFLLAPHNQAFDESHFYRKSTSGTGGSDGSFIAASSMGGGAVGTSFSAASGSSPAASSLSFSSSVSGQSSALSGPQQQKRDSGSRLPAERRCGAVRPQILGAIAETPRGSELLRESSFLCGMVSIVRAVADALNNNINNNNSNASDCFGPSSSGAGEAMSQQAASRGGGMGNPSVSFLVPPPSASSFAGGDAAASKQHQHNNNNNNQHGADVLILNRLLRDPAKSTLSWVPASSYAWESNTVNTAARGGGAGAGAGQSQEKISAGVIEIRQSEAIARVHLALLALGSICTSDCGAELVGPQVLASAVTIAASSIANDVPTTSGFVPSAVACLALAAQSMSGRSFLSPHGNVRCEPYHDALTSSMVQVGFMSPAATNSLISGGARRSNSSHNNSPSNYSSSSSRRGSTMNVANSSSAPPSEKSPELAAAAAAATAATSAAADATGETVVVHLRNMRRSRFSASSAGTFSAFGSRSSAPSFRAWSGSACAKDREAFSAALMMKEPFPAVVLNLNDPQALKSKLATLWKENSAPFLDAGNRAQMRHLLAQAVTVPPESRHVLAVLFYMQKNHVSKFCSSVNT